MQFACNRIAIVHRTPSETFQAQKRALAFANAQNVVLIVALKTRCFPLGTFRFLQMPV